MRRSLDETRALLLKTGLQMLYDRGLFVGVTHVRLGDVAKAAGMTTGAAYRVWGNQEEFHRDLGVAAIRHRDVESIRGTVEHIQKAVADGAPLTEVLRLGAVANAWTAQPNDPFLINLALRAASSAVPELAEASRLRHEESMAAFEELYIALLHRYGRRMRAPFGIEALSHGLAALSEGFAVQALSGLPALVYEVDGLPEGVGREWTLLGIAVEALVERLTEPIPRPAQ